MRLTVAGLFLLSACGLETNPDDRICLTPPAQTPGQWGACVHRWGYRLAGSGDPATTVAQAVVAGCADAIAYQINEAEPGEQAKLANDIMRSAQGLALFHVVQARAGHCAIP